MVDLDISTFSRWWQRWCIAALVGYAVSTIPGVGPDHTVYWFDGTCQVAISLSCALLCYLRARAARSVRIWIWAVGALLAESAAKFYFFARVSPGFREGVSPVDMLIFLMFGQLIIGFALFGLNQRRHMAASADLDGLLVGFGLMTVLAAVGSPWVSRMLTSDDVVNAVIVGYVIVQAILFVLVAVVLAMRRWRFSPECVVMLLVLACGSAWMVLVPVVGDAPAGAPLDTILETRTVLIAFLAGWSHRQPRRDESDRLVVGMPLLTSSVAVAVLVVGSIRSVSPLTVVFAAVTVLLALGRLASSYRQISAADHLRVLAETDELTGLPNRRGFYSRGAEVATRPGTALLLLDLDKFKFVNDTLGHATGDDLLRVMARRLEDVVGEHVLARLGGDEFAVLAPAADAVETARRVVATVEKPVELDGVQLRLGASIGVAVNPDHGADIPQLLRFADVALYRAKERSDAVVVYSPRETDVRSGGPHSRVDAVLLAELRDAIADDALTVHYQPIVSVRDRRLVCAEALVRWDHPTRGMLTPRDFLPLVRESRQTDPMTMSVVRMVAAHSAELSRQGTPVTIAVNLFPPTLGDLDLPTRIKAELDACGVPADSLVVEITEEFVLRDPDCATQVLRDLHAMGVGISVDDFGNGFSSLTYLHRLPITGVKVDHSLTGEVARDERAAALTKSVVDLAHNLGLEVIGEGADTAETFGKLGELGCDKAQGRYISQPVTATELGRWAARQDA